MPIDEDVIDPINITQLDICGEMDVNSCWSSDNITPLMVASTDECAMISLVDKKAAINIKDSVNLINVDEILIILLEKTRAFLQLFYKY
jgi:hypothetical protein